jgi:hypothetical protein
MSTNEDKENVDRILDKILECLNGEAFECICLSLNYALAFQMDYFVDKDKEEKFLNHFKKLTLEALHEVREWRDSKKEIDNVNK